MLNSTRMVLLSGFFCLAVLGVLAAAGAESAFKDTPHFSGMPNHRIADAFDQEFTDYRFHNGKGCTGPVKK